MSEEYDAYLRSARWADVKRRYRASDLPQVCVRCGNPHVDLHHKTYKRIFNERLTDLEPLCREHHIAEHARYRKGKQPKKGKRLASPKMLAYIRRLGGEPTPGMTLRQARKLVARLESQQGVTHSRRAAKRKAVADAWATLDRLSAPSQDPAE